MAALPVLDTHSPTHPGPIDLGATERDRLARELANAVEGEVRFGHHDRMLYATDASLYQVEPIGVVVPAGVEDAARAVAFCVQHRLPILPRGGGTSLAGQCTNRAVVIDFSAACRAVRRIDAAGRTCDVEPGITVDELNEVLARERLFFAPDPATTRQANIGGCIGNNAAGARSIVFGRTSENLESVDALLLAGAGAVHRARLGRGAAANDAVVRAITLEVARVVQQHAALIRERFPKTIRRNAGYNLDLVLNQMEAAGPRADSDAVLDSINLAHLVCGSEGTLAVTVGATLKLHPVPAARGLAIIGFDSLDAAVGCVAPILGTGPSAVELIDDTILDLARANAEYRRYVELMPAPASGVAALRALLYVEYSAADDPAALDASFGSLRSLVSGMAPSARMTVCDSAAAARAWKLRKAGEPLLHGMPGDRKPITFVEDNAVPVEHLSRFVREFRRIVESHGTRTSFWAHASVGVLHVRPLLSLRDDADRERMQRIAVEAADLARSLGGVMSGEHGDGRVRGPLLERHYGPELMRAFRRVKAAFDPLNLLNPGNIVEPGPIESITANLRVDCGSMGRDAAVPVDTYFNFDDQHGLRGAAEMCNGAGVCRKKSGGTMCPSYMGTLDERHSTRGRGNALRLAITGQLKTDPDGSIWNDPGTIETLDLCLSCKACKAECPSNVDIARLKAEYTGQRYREGGAPLAARMMGRVRTLNRLGAMMPAVSNWMTRGRAVRALLRRWLGIDPRRSLPEFARPLRVGRADGGGPRIALFADCFTTYNEPHIGRAAARVLGALGYRVELINGGCCGRAMISNGVLDDAVATIDGTIGRLTPLAEDPGVRAIVFCEPSCLSAVKDDWLQLRLRAPMDVRRRVSAKSWLVEDFVEREWDSHPRRPAVRPDAGSIILHGHCHQKALWGLDSTAALLRRAGGPVRVLDTGCCGMAGGFGYAAHRFDLSMRIGELSLLPAVRAAETGATIVAPGTSCRHQIRDGTGVHAVHPIEHLAAKLI